MIKVYRFENETYTLEYFTCGDTIDTPVDHLHFKFQVHIASHKEQMEGWVSVCREDTEQSIAAKVNQVYLDKVVSSAQTAVKNGSIFLH